MSDVTIGYIGIVVMLGLIIAGMPIYLALGITGFLGILWMMSLKQALASMSSIPFMWFSYYALMTIPLFVLMGNFAFHSGISRALYDTAYKFIGHLPGGLAMSTVVASAGFAAMSGSSIANAASMGTIAIPEMYRYNYDRPLAAGSVAAGGTLGGMIPPSTGFIVIGAITSLSIGKLFMAGIIPGIVMMLIFMAVIYVRAKLNPKLAPPGPALYWKERFASLKDVWMPLAIFLLVMGGIYIGYFTPTEAAAVGAFGTFIFVLVKRKMTSKVITSALVDTTRTSAFLFVIFVGGGIFGFFLTLTGVPMQLANWVAALPVSRWLILVVILAFYIPLGMFMEILAGMIITIPIFYPIVQSLGFDMLWFGVLLQIMGELGLITPPVGMNVYVIKGVSGLSLEEIFRGVLPFILSYTIILSIMLAVPQISLWLPSMMK